jgi:hydroxymethylpyrimidine/phosphomethylpyrimidine kinase
VTRTPAPVSLPVTLTIAGSDSGGGAGIQADIQTMGAHETFPTSVVTSVTAQHTQGVERATVMDEEDVRAQYDAVADDFDIRAAKTGMLATAELVRTVHQRVATADFPLVVDPVMVATSGDRLLDEAGERAYEDLLDEATLVTPNYDETLVLTGIDPRNGDGPREAGQRLVEMGADAALVKGGHADGETVTDVLVTLDSVQEFPHPRVDTLATHGSGCTLSAAITANLARGVGLESAIERASNFVERAIRYPLNVGHGPGTVHHLSGIRNEAARESTAEAVRALVATFVDRDIRPLVPEVGMNVVGATPYAESNDETAAVEGRITRTMDGVMPNRGVRFGASSHVSRFLLVAREYEPSLRFATNCRLSDQTRDALGALDGPVEWFDRADEPAESSTMDWAAHHVFEQATEPPIAIVDAGAVGKEAMIRIVGETAADLSATVERLLAG